MTIIIGSSVICYSTTLLCIIRSSSETGVKMRDYNIGVIFHLAGFMVCRWHVVTLGTRPDAVTNDLFII
jgi:hypothetical protein